MKTAIAIDFLVERNEQVFLLELLLNLFPDAPIYTLVHYPGRIQGEVERRTIYSSYLSQIYKKHQNLKKLYYILPSGANSLKVDPSIERILFISSGYIHGIQCSPKTKKVVYLFDSDVFDHAKLGWQKFFTPYVERFQIKGLQNSKIIYSSQTLANKMGVSGEVVPATFRTEEFPFIPEEQFNPDFSHVLVDLNGASFSVVQSLVKWAQESKDRIYFVGVHPEFEKFLPMNTDKIVFLQEGCEATFSGLSHQAKVVIVPGAHAFPAFAMGALCTGRPVLVPDTEMNHEFISGYQGEFYKDESDLISKLEQMISHVASFDRRKLRRAGLKWNERLFKNQIIAKFMEN